MIYDIAIIGAGAAGLITAKKLSQQGHSVLLLEADKRAGGRMYTLYPTSEKIPFEAGAEFVHGKLPITLSLLKDAGIPYHAIEGRMIFVKQGVWEPSEDPDNHWDLFMKKLKEQQSDSTIDDFFDSHFAEEKYSDLRQSVKNFAHGFDLADTSKASILPLIEEWESQEEEQYRIDGGYNKLTEFLLQSCLTNNVTIHFNTIVKEVNHANDTILLKTEHDDIYEAKRLVVTASVGVLQSESIRFNPSLGETQAAINDMAFGTVIKFMLYFRTAFWEDHAKDIGFLLSDEVIPTWWTQLPRNCSLLTGWVGGTPASKLQGLPTAALLDLSLQSLANIFQRPKDVLATELMHHEIFCWQHEPFIKGGYSYSTLTSPAAKWKVSGQVSQKIYFAGEGFSKSTSKGTVEAALHSGLEIADIIEQDIKQQSS